ncbi:M1-specific T cell receptor beta chain-like [Talpa occidentalis]|uniref:M1-specific T cell receptor beta chain-like n=1 Tax=Talpa occidentalis TaxID=50954 RepID=UPI0018903FA2|nr:M1-specific T cell receptor beta chain-like [Talpa occidentalis]
MDPSFLKRLKLALGSAAPPLLHMLSLPALWSSAPSSKISWVPVPKVAESLDGAGPVDSEVTQNPKYLVTVSGQNANLTCSYEKEHQYVYWYKQARPGSSVPGSRILCCVALCLLAAGPVDSEVTQNPKYLVTASGQNVTLKCSYENGHLSMYWYREAQGHGPKFLVQYYNGNERDKGSLPDRFKVVQSKNDHRSQLNMSLLEPGDTALYLCASSLPQPCRSSSPEHKNPQAQLRK